MHAHRLIHPGFIDPFWLASMRRDSKDAVVRADHSVFLDGVALRFSGEPLPPGEIVRVWLAGDGHLCCETMQAFMERQRLQRMAADEQARRVREARNRMREQAENFNGSIQLPVRWDTGIKDVLSGLGEASWGDGRNKATVGHIYLLEPLRAGRLERKQGDLLCTSAGGSNGKRWSSKVVDRAYDGDGKPFQPQITCKACLALAGRWMLCATDS